MPTLWPGADVRWTGPDLDRDGVILRHGERAVVVDPGRHGAGSSRVLVARRGPAGRGLLARRAGRDDVLIRVADGQVVAVPAGHLEPVASDHPLRPEPDASAAGWWLDQLDGWGQSVPVGAFVPRSLPAVCRVRHVGWEDGFDGRWVGELDPGTAGGLVDVLGGATSTPDDVFVAVWSGWGDLPAERFPGAAHVPTPARGHFLLRGPLDGVLVPLSPPPMDRPVSGIWWPADRAWLVATEIDLPWTFVAGPAALVAQVRGRGDLDATAATHDDDANQPGADAG